MRPRISGNLLRIRDRMLERGLDSQFDLRYHFRTISMETTGDTRKLVAEFVAADIVLIDDYFPLLNAIDPRPETRVIQVWHAGSGFKSVGYSQFGGYESPGLTGAHRKYTFAIAGSTHLVPVYSEVFGIPPEAVIPTGLPRIDTFIDPERTEKLKAEFAASYPQFDGKTIILFAPTFRGGGASSAFYDYSQLDFARLHEACGDDSVILFRMHHFVPDAPPIPEEFADRLVDFSHFPDTNDLLHSVDVLVTDYSSIVYEYSLLNRPMLFFAYDKDLYSATRGFHRSYEDTAPGRICTSIDELVDALETKDFEEWKIERFRAENFDYIDMHSADRVIDQLILNDPRSTPEAEAARELDAKRSRAALRFAAEQMVDDYPDSPVARRAAERLNEMANHKEGP
jgi:CDP-ribitol ribitolphosphotransferase